MWLKNSTKRRKAKRKEISMTFVGNKFEIHLQIRNFVKL